MAEMPWQRADAVVPLAALSSDPRVSILAARPPVERSTFWVDAAPGATGRSAVGVSRLNPPPPAAPVKAKAPAAASTPGMAPAPAPPAAEQFTAPAAPVYRARLASLPAAPVVTAQVLAPSSGAAPVAHPPDQSTVLGSGRAAPLAAPLAAIPLSPRPAYAARPLPERELVPPKDLLKDGSPPTRMHGWRLLHKFQRRPAAQRPAAVEADERTARRAAANPLGVSAATPGGQARPPWLVDAWPFQQRPQPAPQPQRWDGSPSGLVQEPAWVQRVASALEPRRAGPPRLLVMSPKGDAPAFCSMLSSTFAACRQRGNALTEEIVATSLSEGGSDALSPELLPFDGRFETEGARDVVADGDALLVTVGPGIDAMYAASLAIDHLRRDRPDLVENAVVALERPAGFADLSGLERHFTRSCRTVVQVPPDPALRGGDGSRFERLQPSARVAWLELAAALAGGFPSALDPSVPR